MSDGRDGAILQDRAARAGGVVPAHMRILVISQYFPPDITAAAFRVGETVELLRSWGHDVRVITAMPHKSSVTYDQGERDVYRVAVDPVGAGGARRYVQHYLSFARRSLAIGAGSSFKGWRPAVLWASSPPLFVGLPAVALSRWFRCPLVFDVRDIWPQSAVSAGQISEQGAAFRLGRLLEKVIYDRASHITCVARPMAGYIATRTTRPTTVIYNGAPDLASDLEHSIGTAARVEKRLAYAGNFGRVQGLDACVHAFAAAVRKGLYQGWTFELLGGGANEAELRRLVRDLDMEQRILFHATTDKNSALAWLASSAMLLINLKGDEVFDLTIPSKVFDYMSVGRPILFGLRGEGREILQSTGANMGFEPGDPASLLEALERAWLRLDELEAAARTNPAIVRERYSRRRNTQALLEVLQQVQGATR